MGKIYTLNLTTDTGKPRGDVKCYLKHFQFSFTTNSNMSHLLQLSITKIGYFGKKIIKNFNIPGEKKDKQKILKKTLMRLQQRIMALAEITICKTCL